MKKLVFFLLIPLCSCLDNEPEPTKPDFSASVVGTYELTWIDYWDGRYTLPSPGFSGKLVIEKISATQFKQTYQIKVPVPHHQYKVDTISDVDTLTLTDYGATKHLVEATHLTSVGDVDTAKQQYSVDLQYQRYPLLVKTKFKKVI